MLNINVITLFPEFFDSPLHTSLMGRALQNRLLNFTFINPRDFSKRPHRNVDDRPFGGGPGMLMQLDPLLGALNSIKESGPILQMSPDGQMFTADMARELSECGNITLICGRYEGIDARLADFYPLREVSICQAVLNGGESAALTIIEAVSRFLPGFLGKDESCMDETFSDGLLEYPQYTRPESYMGCSVPKILLGGNHALISEWRRKASLAKTLSRRPELLNAAPLNRKDAEYLRSIPREKIGRSISFCLCHFPVRLEQGRIGSSSLTNLDIHDIARISCGYGMGPFYVLLALQEQRDILNNILGHWRRAANPEVHEDRKRALAHVCPVHDFSELEEKACSYYGVRPAFIATSANWPESRNERQLLSPEDVRKISRNYPVIILLGTARGLDLKSLAIDCQFLRPLRFLDENHLSVRSAAAIIADRILGDFY